MDARQDPLEGASIRSRVRRVTCTVALLLALTGCSTLPASGDATAAVLGAKFGGCDGDHVEIEAVGFLSGVGEWVHVVDVLGRDDSREDQDAVVVRTAEGEPHRYILDAARPAGIEWALENDAEVWFAIADPAIWEKDLVATVTIVTDGGEVFFSGRCSDLALRQPLTQRLGEKTNRLLAGIPHVEPADVERYLGLVSGTPAPTEVILNPDTADAALLASLTLIGVTITTTSAPGDGGLMIVTRIPAGWNDAVPIGDLTLEGAAINAYVDDTGILEFWLVDGSGDVSVPYGRLGRVDTHGASVSVLVNTSLVFDDGAIGSGEFVTVVD
ncbi:hypothetical protein KZX37_04305 [Microbacterium sp. EYE_5]|uniref:hypothetical protein n=1 Tax=unclassified Microbacterium TaxID=2609290 RepID=UPI002006667B|nr:MULTISPECIES: hypothetical protein [unclassified Microbacterium]MCK6079841.1 hypothetical protein [Microbacterium sp. EYE_382]MCK6085112.1 hypothetical protein [Microbacterium sp. EYE_384]MCK6122662.1 hypothetical protein [Microbacterium sp. EYE_80]MCK6125875.1 hypothetical protein [Microbacterium sp. EYE_79]MCK6140796.1 hypothetical protein [Microbacterium sp. EYE_39]